MNQPPDDETEDDTDHGTTIEVDCPHSGVFGDHKVTLDKPIIDKSIGIDPFCRERYRVHAGPPIKLTKVH